MGFDFAAADKVARAWFEAYGNGGLELAPGVTITRPYGWVFLGNDVLDLVRIGGPCFLLVTRLGEVRVFGPSPPLEFILAEYEASIPPTELSMVPELPPGAGNTFHTGRTTIYANKPVRPDEFPSALRDLWITMRHYSAPRHRWWQLWR